MANPTKPETAVDHGNLRCSATYDTGTPREHVHHIERGFETCFYAAQRVTLERERDAARSEAAYRLLLEQQIIALHPSFVPFVDASLSLTQLYDRWVKAQDSLNQTRQKLEDAERTLSVVVEDRNQWHREAIEKDKAIAKLRDEAARNGELLLQCVICWEPQVSHQRARQGHDFERHPSAPSLSTSQENPNCGAISPGTGQYGGLVCNAHRIKASGLGEGIEMHASTGENEAHTYFWLIDAPKQEKEP